jgi:DNA-binding PadR family transcriptional regulator
MYEFMILGILMDGPCHGYGIRRIAEHVFGTDRTVAWGTLYATLHKLQEAGLVDLCPLQAGEPEARNGPPGKWYCITDAGRQRFAAHMQPAQEPDGDADLTFTLQITRFGHVGREQRLILLRHHLNHCRRSLTHLAQRSHQVAGAQDLTDQERSWILLSIDRRRALHEADVAWVTGQLAALAQSDAPAIRTTDARNASGGSILIEHLSSVESERITT